MEMKICKTCQILSNLKKVKCFFIRFSFLFSIPGSNIFKFFLGNLGGICRYCRLNSITVTPVFSNWEAVSRYFYQKYLIFKNRTKRFKNIHCTHIPLQFTCTILITKHATLYRRSFLTIYQNVIFLFSEKNQFNPIQFNSVLSKLWPFHLLFKCRNCWKWPDTAP